MKQKDFESRCDNKPTNSYQGHYRLVVISLLYDCMLCLCYCNDYHLTTIFILIVLDNNIILILFDHCYLYLLKMNRSKVIKSSIKVLKGLRKQAWI